MTTASVSTDSLFAGLTEPQRAAVAHTHGPLLVLAAAGSGKTRVITRRAAHLAATVARPDQVLAITFTNKAAREMQERVAALGVGRGMQVSTFHAWCARTLRIYANRAGVDRNFTILDTDDRRKLLKTAIEQCGLSATNYAPARVEATVSQAKSSLLTADEFADRDGDWYHRTVAKVYSCYEQLRTQAHCLDFDDLLLVMAQLLRDDAELRDQLEDRHPFVLIDEYQDTNAAQYRIVRLLTQRGRNLCATGDPDQSIYGWRGADIGNILSFERDFPDAAVVQLEQNYRSTQRILAAADALIAGNVQRKQKGLWTQNPAGERVRVVEVGSGAQEAATIAADIQLRCAAGARRQDIAVFYRINSLSRPIEEALLQAGVPYQIARGVEFYNRKEIKDILAYLRVLVNPADEVALLRVINVPPRGIGATTVDRLTAHARAAGQPISAVLADPPAEVGRGAAAVRAFAALLAELTELLDRSPTTALQAVLSQSGLQAHYRGEQRADASAGGNLDELINAAGEFERTTPDATLVDWLEHTALISDVDAVREDGGAVTLMTLHAAKGLEFPEVYIVGLEDGLLPMRRDDQSESDEEEERRLCFVGMTRAQQRLTLTRARFRMLRGQTQRTTRSGFLDELPRNDVQWVNVGESAPAQDRFRDRGQLPDDVEEWHVGTLVRHPRLGLGQIVVLERGARRTHVQVRFETGREESWVLEFAQLERVDYDEIG